MSNLFIWNTTNKLDLLSDVTDGVKKISNIADHLYLVTCNNDLYHGIVEVVENREQIRLVKHNGIKTKDLDCSDEHVYVVDVNGKVIVCTENLEVVKEIVLVEDSKFCAHGQCGTKFKMKVDKISIGRYGILFLTDNGQLWAMGNMRPIGINSDMPKRVSFFEKRLVYNAEVGHDFAIAVVSKNLNQENDNYDEEVLESSCPGCISESRLTSPVSLNSFSDACPLGLPIPASYDIETTSTSSKNDSSSSNDVSKCLQNGDVHKHSETSDSTDKTEKNIIFRNTEAAKEYLTRQLSWMSSAGEEYLVECTEKPTRIIKENVSTVANLVYEGVKTVGDKVATLSRHVSGSSDTTDILESIEDLHLPRVTSKDEFMWSLSQGTSEKDVSEQGTEERCCTILKNGSNLLNGEVWTWGNILHGQLGNYLSKIASCMTRVSSAQGGTWL